MPSIPVPRSARATRWLAMCLLLAAMLAGPGCLRRRLTVHSNVPGARVFIDDQEIGHTPAATEFTYYGTRKIQLVKDRYKTATFYHRIRPPWYQIPPLDFISENLVPWEIRDERRVEVQMEAQEYERPEQLLQRAEGMRSAPLAHR